MDDIIDAIIDIPYNLAECGLRCAQIDFTAVILWVLNRYQTLPCDNVLFNILLGEC